LGDDLESFALVLLWLVGKYAPNEMSDNKRAKFLQTFDDFNEQSKANMLRIGGSFVNELKIQSKNLRYLLADLLDGYRYRYTELGRREQREPGNLEEHKRLQAQLESHKWLMDTLNNALKAEEWKALRDPAKDQGVEPLFQRARGRRRKSVCSEYDG
jgi:hypothetical protein